MQRQDQSEQQSSDTATIEQQAMMARVSFLQDAFFNNNNMALAHQAPLIPPSFLGSASFYDTMNKASFEPTNSDVLLGRGVATNRHPGNENFRRIVSQHVDAYMASTKKQKMTISRSIVNHVRTELDPPGKFLEKNPLTGLWHEVDDKRAFEKTAQALRDGAAPLRKQQLITDDKKSSKSPDSSSGEKGANSSDGKSMEGGKPSSKTGDTTAGSTTSESLIKLVPKKGKRHRRTKTAPVNLSDVFSSGDATTAAGITAGPRPKKLRSNPDIAAAMTNPAPTEMDKLFMAEMLSQGNSLFAPFEEQQSQQKPVQQTQVHSVLQQHQHQHQQVASVDSNSNRHPFSFSTQHQHHQRNPSLTTSFFNALQFTDPTRVSNEGQSSIDANINTMTTPAMMPSQPNYVDNGHQQSSSLMNNNFMAPNTSGGGPNINNNNNSYLDMGQHQQQQQADYYAPLPINKPILGSDSSANTLDLMLKALEPLAHQFPQHSSVSQMQTKMASSLIQGADFSMMASSGGSLNPPASNTLYHNASVTGDMNAHVGGENRENNFDNFFGLSGADETNGNGNEFNDGTDFYQNKGS